MQNLKHDYDAVVIGSGPNGLAAAILMQQQGLSVLVVEGKSEIGGGLRTAELTLPGFKHDICSAIHPLAMASPFLKDLPLASYGLEYIMPALAAAHPFEDGRVAILHKSIEKTAGYLGADAATYARIMKSVTDAWPLINVDVLGPLRFPKHPLALAGFGLKALNSANAFVNNFKSEEARGLFGGMAAHALQPLTNYTTAAIALVLLAAGHLHNWPIPKGGSQSIADALTAYFKSLGGIIQTGTYVSSMQQLPSARAYLFDVTPRQLLTIAGHKFSPIYKWQLQRYRYGMGVFKIDWALDGPIPFMAEECRQAGTVHLGNTFEEIRDGEFMASQGIAQQKPYVLLAQQSVYDGSRAPEGKHTVWAYCHVPHGSTKDMTAVIENQVERFAPGFKDLILAKNTMNTVQVEEYNPNYIGGDINGGVLDIGQLFTRPALRLSPYKTSAKGLYICSSSTPPGGGVHGMCGYHAARNVLKDIFGIAVKPLN